MKLARQLGLREQVIEDWYVGIPFNYGKLFALTLMTCRFLRRRREKIALEDNKAARS